MIAVNNAIAYLKHRNNLGLLYKKTVFLSFLQLDIYGHAQSILAKAYPNKPFRTIVRFAPGGAYLAARAIAEPLSAVFKHPVLIENRLGLGVLLLQIQWQMLNKTSIPFLLLPGNREFVTYDKGNQVCFNISYNFRPLTAVWM